MRRSRQRRRRGKITRHPFGPMRLAISLCLRASLALTSQRNRLETPEVQFRQWGGGRGRGRGLAAGTGRGVTVGRCSGRRAVGLCTQARRVGRDRGKDVAATQPEASARTAVPMPPRRLRRRTRTQGVVEFALTVREPSGERGACRLRRVHDHERVLVGGEPGIALVREDRHVLGGGEQLLRQACLRWGGLTAPSEFSAQ